MGELKSMWPFQQRGYDGIVGSLRSGHRRPICQIPTGGGKTVLASHIVTGALKKHKKVAFLVPMIGLIDQTHDRFAENGIDPMDMGIVQGDHPLYRPDAPVQICSIQTIGRRFRPEADFVLVDEAHLRFKTVSDWMESEPQKIFIGLTATAWSRGLAGLYDDLIVPTSIRELIEGGWLSPFRVFAPYHPDLEGVETVPSVHGGRDYHEGQLAERMGRSTVVANVIDTWMMKAERRSTLVFAVDLAHAALLHRRFSEAGVASAYVDADTCRDQRGEIGRQLNDGRLEVVVSVGTMTTGLDLDVRFISLARPTKSEILLTQLVGRGLRTAPGKDFLLVLDHSDSTLNLGLVTDINHDKLRAGKLPGERQEPESSPPKPHECPACHFVIPPFLAECPNCGHSSPVISRAIEVEGELVEFEKAAAIQRAKKKENREWSPEEKAIFYGQLKGYASERMFRDGWAAHKYQEKFDVWPNHPSIKYAPELPCGPAVRTWIRSRMIAWRNSSRNRLQ